MFSITTTCPSDPKFRQVVNFGSASYVLQERVYSATKAIAGLDTPWGVAASNEAFAWDGSKPIAINIGGHYLVKAWPVDMVTG